MESTDLLTVAALGLTMVAFGLIGMLANADREIRRLMQENRALQIADGMQKRTIDQLRTDVARLKWNITTKERPNG